MCGVVHCVDILLTDSYTTRLFWLKGRKTVFVRQVELSRLSLNSGDVFILDTPRIIYQVRAFFMMHFLVCLETLHAP